MRIYTSDNTPLDFHENCAPQEFEAMFLYNDGGHGPDGRGNCFVYDTEHPDYETDEYFCEECGERIADNWS